MGPGVDLPKTDIVLSLVLHSGEFTLSRNSGSDQISFWWWWWFIGPPETPALPLGPTVPERDSAGATNPASYYQNASWPVTL